MSRIGRFPDMELLREIDMTHLILIGALKTGTSQRLVRAALDRGYDLTIISPEEDELRGIFPPEAKVISMPMEASVIVRWILRECADAHSRILITTTHDRYIQCAAEVCAAVSVPGPNPGSLSALASKTSQREFLRSLGLATPAFDSISIADIGSLREILNRFRFPIVIKPERGSSSFGVSLCNDAEAAIRHANELAADFRGKRQHCLTDILLIEEFVPGREYCVELFDGKCVGVIRKEKRAGNTFIERGYTSELDLESDTFDAIVLVCEKAVTVAGFVWGPVHIDCIVRDGVAYIVEINPRIAGSFITEIVQDAYGFDIVAALIRKLQGIDIGIPTIFAPVSYARVEFFLGGDPGLWHFDSEGSFETRELRVRYGPQVIESRERRGYLYVTKKVSAERAQTYDIQAEPSRLVEVQM
jgi:carbamoylphosphate synthase large subunit